MEQNQTLLWKISLEMFFSSTDYPIQTSDGCQQEVKQCLIPLSAVLDVSCAKP